MVLKLPARRTVRMNNYCAFSKEHRCLKWTDCEVARFELEEADELCHANWIEIQHLQERVTMLKELLQKSRIDVPTKY